MDSDKLSPEIFNTEADSLTKLATLFPAAVKDGQLDIAALREELGQFEEVGAEKYELTWAGKQAAKKLSQTDVAGRTLKYIPEDSKNPDTTQNLYIEGDNLEVLKLLRQNYYGAVKMIYIDPPYNTGNDFVYRDNFAMNKAESDEAEGEIVDGERMVVNQKSSNRFHANWLNMMYPRLQVAKDLLREDGVILINCDDNEVASLRHICDEIFSVINFQGCILWKKKTNGNNMGVIPPVHDYIIVYSKNSLEVADIGFDVPYEEQASNYSNPDNDPRGPWDTMDLSANHKGPHFAITNPSNGQVHYPPQGRYWVFNEKEVLKRIGEGRIIFGKSGTARPVQKVFFKDRGTAKRKAESWWDKHGMNEDATEELTELFQIAKIFSHPKPTILLKNIISIVTQAEDIVLDFFSGSGTTADAVMQVASDKSIALKNISVQLQENLEKSLQYADSNAKASLEIAIDFLKKQQKPLLLSELGKERIRRAGEKIKAEIENANAQLNPGEEPKQVPDIGFRVFRVVGTNIRWTHEALKSKQLTFDDDMLSEKDKLDFMPGFSDIDVVYEILLRQRDIPLSAKVEKLDIGKRTYMFADAYIVCLDESVSAALVEEMAAVEPTPIKYVFRDSAFDDNISLKDETMRRLEAYIARNSGEQKKAYTVEFI